MYYSDEQKKVHVKSIQHALQQISLYTGEIPYVTIDGIYNINTMDVVKIFQKMHGLEPTGLVDSETWKEIFEVYRLLMKKNEQAKAMKGFPDVNYIVKRGSSGGVVYVIQAMINAIKPHFSNIDFVDYTGVLDETTQKQIRLIQQTGQLIKTGEVDKETWDILTSLFNAYSSKLPTYRILK